MTTPLERYLPLLIDGDTDASYADLAPEAVIHDPITGRIFDPVTYSFLIARHVWLHDRAAAVEHVRTIAGPGRAVVEAILHLTEAQRAIDLPVALVAELDPEGKIRLLRVYHSSWPLTGENGWRRPLMRPDEALVLPEPVGSYMRALAAGDVEGVLATFVPDASVREPSGPPLVHSGPEGRREFYARILAGGGIPLDHCTVTDDGAACAVEYNVVKWGAAHYPALPGVAVYERAGPTQIAAARIYDDVAPPE